MFNGKRGLILSGEIHYARIPEAEWAAGMNYIASYVFWNWHEPQKNHHDLSGPLNLERFLNLCDERGLKVFFRAEPYCYAEWNYGGFPA